MKNIQIKMYLNVKLKIVIFNFGRITIIAFCLKKFTRFKRTHFLLYAPKTT